MENVPADEGNNLDTVRKWLWSHQYKADNDTKISGQSNLLVIVSKSMMQTYNTFKDLLEFSIHPTELRYTHQKTQIVRSYQIGVFTVFDTNERPLLAGYALLNSGASWVIKQAIEYFFAFQNHQYPNTLMTGAEPDVLEAVRLLREQKSYMGNHRIKLESVFKIIETSFPGTPA